MITIEAAKASLSDEDFNKAYDILIEAYAITELKIWGESYFRISKEEYRELIAKNEVVFAKIDNCVVGCIHFHQKDAKTYTFGLLAADFTKKGKGIGRALVNYAEQKAIVNGADKMVLVILRAKDFEIDNKIFLKEWYERMGYQYVSSQTFLEIEPARIEKSKKLITPVLFDAYTKVLP